MGPMLAPWTLLSGVTWSGCAKREYWFPTARLIFCFSFLLQICLESYATGQVSSSKRSTANIIAHEVAHLLGCYHDTGEFNTLRHGPLARYVKLWVTHGNVFSATAGFRSRHASWQVRHARDVMHAGMVNWRLIVSIIKFGIKLLIHEVWEWRSNNFIRSRPTAYRRAHCNVPPLKGTLQSRGERPSFDRRLLLMEIPCKLCTKCPLIKISVYDVVATRFPPKMMYL